MSGAIPNDDARRADDEAIEWVLVLREEPDDPDVRRRFDAWVAASPLNARAWAETSYAYERAGDAQHRATPGRSKIGAPRRIVNRRALVATAAGLAAAWLAVAAAPAVMLRLEADHATGTAELREVPLADGSTAHLAPGSAIAIADVPNRRHVRLLKGEAWFEVRPDPSRPFQVEADGVTTTVLGTAFDVKRDAFGVTTELARGRVRIEYVSSAPPVAEQLEPGDRVRVGFDGAVTRAVRPVAQMAAWRSRQIVVEDRPVSDVVDALRPWFRGVILLRGESFARQRVTGVYNTADPVEALRGLVRAHGGRVSRITPWIVVLTER